jgi:hypothetical protein
MAMLGFFSPKNPLYKLQHIFFCHPQKETLVTIENDFPNPSDQQFVCACHIWPSAHPTFSNSQLTHIIVYKWFKRAVTSVLCKFKAISSSIASMKTSNIVATWVTL